MLSSLALPSFGGAFLKSCLLGAKGSSSAPCCRGASEAFLAAGAALHNKSPCCLAPGSPFPCSPSIWGLSLTPASFPPVPEQLVPQHGALLLQGWLVSIQAASSRAPGRLETSAQGRSVFLWGKANAECHPKTSPFFHLPGWAGLSYSVKLLSPPVVAGLEPPGWSPAAQVLRVQRIRE